MESLRAAFEMLRSDPIRFLLTISGIVVGVASLILLASLLAVGEKGLQSTSSKALGADLLTISNDWQAMDEYNDRTRLTQSDIDALESSVLLDDNIQYTPLSGGRRAILQQGTKQGTGRLFGVHPEALDMYALEVAEGRAFLPNEYEGTWSVILVGSEIMDGKLHPGDRITVDGKPSTVVGILATKPTMGPGEFGWNNRVLMPVRLHTLEFNPERRPSDIVVKANISPDAPDGISAELQKVRKSIEIVLMSKRRYPTFQIAGGEGRGGNGGTEEIIMTVIKALIYLTTLFSMVVGGINIMNIMLVTVTERTREIGIRRAIGATRSDIVRQFLAETLAVTLVGAVTGVGTALGLLGFASWALTKWWTPWPFHVSVWSVVTGVLFSMLIGLVFGMFPAIRASRLDPVEALRYDG